MHVNACLMEDMHAYVWHGCVPIVSVGIMFQGGVVDLPGVSSIFLTGVASSKEFFPQVPQFYLMENYITNLPEKNLLLFFEKKLWNKKGAVMCYILCFLMNVSVIVFWIWLYLISVFNHWMQTVVLIKGLAQNRACFWPFFLNIIQWRIQDFPGVGNPWVCQPIIWPIFPKTTWKWRNFGTKDWGGGGAHVPHAPRSTTAIAHQFNLSFPYSSVFGC